MFHAQSAQLGSSKSLPEHHQDQKSLVRSAVNLWQRPHMSHSRRSLAPPITPPPSKSLAAEMCRQALIRTLKFMPHAKVPTTGLMGSSYRQCLLSRTWILLTSVPSGQSSHRSLELRSRFRAPIWAPQQKSQLEASSSMARQYGAQFFTITQQSCLKRFDLTIRVHNCGALQRVRDCSEVNAENLQSLSEEAHDQEVRSRI